LNIDLFYEIIFQIYEEEKSKKGAKIERCLKMALQNDEKMILDYALNLYKQQRYFESINI